MISTEIHHTRDAPRDPEELLLLIPVGFSALIFLDGVYIKDIVVLAVGLALFIIWGAYFSYIVNRPLVSN
jgi:hypothetical protein